MTSRTWVRAQSRPRRALFLSSPIGLGHARRDLAIAQHLRNHHPDLEIHYDRVVVSLTTHDAGGVTQKDFDLAGEIDACA